MKFARWSAERSLMSRESRRGPRASRVCRPALGLERFEERVLLSTAIVSINATGAAAANGNSDFANTLGEDEGVGVSGPQEPQGNLSADGTQLVFVSDATNLVSSPSDTNQASDVFVRNTTTGATTLVSVTPDGKSSGNGASFDPVISPNGQYVAFVSYATNLTGVTAQATNPALGQGMGNLYVRDLQTNTTTLLDQTPAGMEADGWSTGQFVFSPDSKSLAWIDTSDDLTTAKVDPNSGSTPDPANPGGPLAPTYVYVRDLAAQSTSLVSVSTAGQASGDDSQATTLVFSPDSNSLVFASGATDLTANTPENAPDPDGYYSSMNLFLRNLTTATTTLLTPTTVGQLSAGVSTGAVFSPNGQSVAFTSDATNLTANLLDPAPEPGEQLDGGISIESNVFVRDLTTATTSLVSATPSGLASNGTAGFGGSPIVFSPDGSLIAFPSNATDLTSNPVDLTPAPGADSSGETDIFNSNLFVRDLTTGITTLVSVTPDGMLSSGGVNQFLFSPDGKYLAFTSSAGDLTKNALETTLPTIAGQATYPGLNDQGPINNVFVRDLAAGTTTLASVTTTGLLPDASASGLVFSPDSGSLFFTSTAIDLTSNPPDATAASLAAEGVGFGFNGTNLFVRDLTAGTTSLISATADGQLSTSGDSNFVLSPDGQTLFFDSNAADMASLGSNPDNKSTEIFAATAPFTASNQFQFASWSSSAGESSGPAVITVVRTGPATGAASVGYSVQNGSAVAGTDFAATSGTLNFAAGQTSQTISIPLKPGDHFAGTRSASVVLSNPLGGTLGYSSSVLNLTSTPAPPVPTPTPVTPVKTVAPAPGPIVLSATPVQERHGKTSLIITFNQALDPASAISSANYHVTIPGSAAVIRHGHRTAARPSRPLSISKVAYDAATKEVTLSLRKPLHGKEAIELQITGTAGGVAGRTVQRSTAPTR